MTYGLRKQAQADDDLEVPEELLRICSKPGSSIPPTWSSVIRCGAPFSIIAVSSLFRPGDMFTSGGNSRGSFWIFSYRTITFLLCQRRAATENKIAQRLMFVRVSKGNSNRWTVSDMSRILSGNRPFTLLGTSGGPRPLPNPRSDSPESH